MTACLVVDCRSTTGVSPETVIVSWTPPTVRSALIVTTAVPLSATPERTMVLNPVSANVTV